MYGGHITDAWDRRTCNAYLQAFQNEGLFEELELGVGFKAPRPFDMNYNDNVKYTEEIIPPERPTLFGLHANAEIGYLTTSAENLLLSIMTLDNGEANGNDEKGYNESLRATMSSLLERLPERFDMITLSSRAAQLLSSSSGPYVVVALQECSRMNLLLDEIERSLIELEKGLKGQLRKWRI
jgi:dynein heavy chain, axonemal